MTTARPGRKIHALSMVKNEADIIEDFVRHNLNYVDELHVLLQESSDGTTEILDALVAEGLNLVVHHDRDTDYNQGEKLTSYAKLILARDDCEFLLIIDADEFIKAASIGDFREAVLNLPAGHYGCFHWDSYVPTEAGENPGPMLSRITHRRRAEAKPVYKILLIKHFLDPDLYLHFGSHNVFSRRNVVSNARVLHLKKASFAHFPVRSQAQIVDKVVHGLAKLDALVKPGAQEKVGFHWRRIRSHIIDGRISFPVMQRIAADYQFDENHLENGTLPELVEDPLPVAYQLRYAGLRKSAR